MELTPPVEDAIFGAISSTDSVLLAKIDMDSTNGNFRIQYTGLSTSVILLEVVESKCSMQKIRNY